MKTKEKMPFERRRLKAEKTSHFFRVITPYLSTSIDPIRLHRGDRVMVGRDYDGNPEWNNWTWCVNLNGQQGWVPRDLLKISGAHGEALEDYNARELSVDRNDAVEVLKIINGWAWARDTRGETGWVPLRDLEPKDPIAPGAIE